MAFLRDLLHELKDPFAAIYGGLELCADTAPVDPQQQERLLGAMRRSSQTIKTVLDDASAYLRSRDSWPAGQRESCDLRSLLQGAVERLRAQSETRGQSVTVQSEALWFRSDREAFGRCISSLLGSLSRLGGGEARLEVTTALEGDRLTVCCRCREASPGTDERADERADYRRLLAQRLADRLGASLQAGEGPEWRLELPYLAAEPVVGPMVEGVAAPPFPSTLPPRVLVVDDNVDGADTMAMWLEAHGFEVATAYDGEQGLAEYSSFQPQIGLFDVGLPRKDGYELARDVRAAGFQGTLVAITGYGQEKDRVEALASGFNHHLVKPVDLDRLTELLQQASPSVNKPRVVVVEDNPLALSVVVRMLERLGADVIGCPTAEDGLLAISHKRPSFVLCDLGLPGMDGFSMASHLRESANHHSLRLLALTGDAAASEQRALEAGFDQVLDKPINEATLRDLLHQAG